MKKLLLCTLLNLLTFFTYAQTANEALGDDIVQYGTDGSGDPMYYNPAGSSITTGDYNVLIGDAAGNNLYSGSNNTMLGTLSGANQTTASKNIFIGAYAGFSNVYGTDNTFIGTEAGYSNTGTDNTFVGTEAGENNTTGADNVFIGEEAGYGNTTGRDNVFIGEDAGYYNTTADDNTFVGSIAGRNNMTGFRNTFLGAEAGYHNTTGYRNTFVGDSTGVDVGVGRLNTFVGQAAGAATEHADYNTFIGAHAGGDNNRTNNTDDANRNTYVGVFTGFSNREGQDNVGMGAFANYRDPSEFDIINITGRFGAYTTTTTRDRTTFIGAQAFPNNNDVVVVGYQSRADGAYGIAIGSQSRAQNNTSVALGRNVTVAQNNTMALGGDTTDNRYSVGIGTTAANQNASLELADTDKGFLINRLTTAERVALETAAANGLPLDAGEQGLMVYDTDLDALFTWDGAAWNTSGANTDNQELDLTDNTLSISGGIETVDLSAYLDNEDEQDLTSATLTGTDLAIAIENGASVTVDLAPILSALETENTTQQTQLDSQAALISDLTTRIEELEACACGGTLGVANPNGNTNRGQKAILYQNIPNPFNGTTSIKYFVPYKHNQAAIVFSNTSGQVIDNVAIKNLGEQELYFNSESLSAGMYYYTLYVDGQKIDTKKMLIE
ncbi:T9SS type A sorting domain-containing protein [Mangrovimonas cancribranchiae]|uniref:T9SS type A sorting domain-containing protein n=1 Tax=Mangrovimonas cancribranchiae TaxID=3080055 RepID=A0AAU6P0G0_9FLAO